MNRYISDLHFGHANILKFDNRPFRNTEEMETALIENWNSTVSAVKRKQGTNPWKP